MYKHRTLDVISCGDRILSLNIETQFSIFSQNQLLDKQDEKFEELLKHTEKLIGNVLPDFTKKGNANK